MNYRHGFHAGNFADVFKHIVLMRILTHLLKKETPFRVVDTHAGSGRYDLASDEAARGGEWQGGIGAFREARFSPEVEALLTPYHAALLAEAPDSTQYPGSPLFIRHALRAQDRAVFNELHPEANAALRLNIGRDPNILITELDAYIAWKAQIPPPERRGLVLVDPPFEKPDEFGRMIKGLTLMANKWATGIAALWYPIKHVQDVANFERAARGSGFAKLLCLEIHVDAPDGPLAACGMLIANPPWMLAEEMALILPELSKALARANTARFACEWLVGP